MIKPLDVPKLAEEFRAAKPFPFIKIDGFLEDAFVQQVVAALPSFEAARRTGFEFHAVNESRKVQITNPEHFAEPIKQLNEALQSRDFLAQVEAITGIPKLLADASLAGGGIHETGPRGRLDVHVDFNYLEKCNLFRRLNILLYLNPVWEPGWGGCVELWDQDVTRCWHSFLPIANRCVLFETSEISYHGVTAVTCPPDQVRKSFAAYYYTREPPESYSGVNHDTVFRARPDEKLKGWVLMPAETAWRAVKRQRDRLKQTIKQTLGIERKH